MYFDDGYEYYARGADVMIDKHEIRYIEGYYATINRLKAAGRPPKIAFELVEDALMEYWGNGRYSSYESFKSAYYRWRSDNKV